MNILIAGACGFIGSHVSNLLTAEGLHNIFAVDNLTTGNPDSISPEVKLLRADLCETEKVADFVAENHIDAIYNFAGKIIVPESVANPYLYYSTNTFNTASLAETALKCGVKYFIFSSTAAVYKEPKNGENLPEDAPTEPLSPYGASKLMSERIISDISKTGNLRFANLRYFNVAGAMPDCSNGQRNPRGTHLIKMCCNALLGKSDALKIYGRDYNTPDGTGIRDYIHICDLAAAHIEIFDYLRKGGSSDTFNVGYGRGSSVLEVVEAMGRAAGRPVPTVDCPRRAGDCARIVSSNEKILAKTSWRPKFDSLDLIARTAYNWEKSLINKD